MNLLSLYIAAFLMAAVGITCALLFVVWSIPPWRQRLGGQHVPLEGLNKMEATSLTGWSAVLGIVLISSGIATCAVVGLYGCVSVLNALGVTS